MGNRIKELKEKLLRKEQECERLNKDLHQNFEEKDKLHLIIDRLLEASGYDTNTASAEDFEDVYENMRYEKQQLDQLKAELEQEKTLKEMYFTYYKAKHSDVKAKLFQYKQALTEIKDYCNKYPQNSIGFKKYILQLISEVEDDRQD